MDGFNLVMLQHALLFSTFLTTIGRHIVDTHVHNAFTSQIRYTFTKSFPSIAHDWNISQFYAAAASTTHYQGARNHVSVVLMELDKDGDVYNQSLVEATLYQRVAESCDVEKSGCNVLGIIASAPFDDGKETMQTFLKSLLDVAPRVRGVRDALWKSNASQFVNQTYWDALRTLESYELPLDLLVRADQLGDVIKLIDAVPNLKVNIDHLAYPNITATQFDSEWAANIFEMARRPNVFMKLSGLPQAYKSTGWTPRDFQPYVDTVVKAFGPTRINFAGNWFVLNLFGNYSSMFTAVDACLHRFRNSQALSEQDLDSIYAGTAERLYRLTPSTDVIV